jgi:hypothetical protein
MKYVKILSLVLAGIVASIALWCGVAWGLGWGIHLIFKWWELRPSQYMSVGSVILVFTVAVQILTISGSCLFMLAWGQSKLRKG